MRTCALARNPGDAAPLRRTLLQPVGSSSAAACASRPLPSMFALLRIRKYQCKTDLLIKKAQFVRLVRETGQDFGDKNRFSPAALEALHENSESYLVSLFKDTNPILIHVKRIAITPYFL